MRRTTTPRSGRVWRGSVASKMCIKCIIEPTTHLARVHVSRCNMPDSAEESVVPCVAEAAVNASSTRPHDADDDEESRKRQRVASAWAKSDEFVPGVTAISNMNRVRHATGRIYDAPVTAKGGCRVVNISGQRYRHHRLVYWKTHGVLRPGCVDHYDRNKLNNSPDNLRLVTRSANMAHSQLDPTRRSNTERMSRPVVGQLAGETREFPSLTEAARVLGIGVQGIIDCCRVRMKQTRGWTFSYKVEDDLPGEEWRIAVSPSSQSRTRVSNMGRLQAKRSGKYFPLPCKKDGYCSVHLDGKLCQVHRVICATFNGPPSEGQEADHINGVRSDNRASNLRWLSLKQNRAKRGHQPMLANRRAVLVQDPCGSSVRYKSSTTAAVALCLSRSNVETIIRRGSRNKGRSFSFVDNQPYEGECFLNLTPEDLAAHEYRPDDTDDESD